MELPIRTIDSHATCLSHDSGVLSIQASEEAIYELITRRIQLNMNYLVTERLDPFAATPTKDEAPSTNPQDLLPDDIGLQHAIAYLYLNVFQQSHMSGLDNWEGISDLLVNWDCFRDRDHALATCSQVAAWTQRRLRPKDMRSHAWALIELIRGRFQVEEMLLLLDDLRDMSSDLDDPSRDVELYLGFLECAFMGHNRTRPEVTYATSDALGWENLFRDTICTLIVDGSLNSRQKLIMKETFCYCADRFDLRNEIDLLDYSLVEGRDVFRHIDYPLHFYE